jgi:hypothetical protein
MGEDMVGSIVSSLSGLVYVEIGRYLYAEKGEKNMSTTMAI